jgi:hypothetical protein
MAIEKGIITLTLPKNSDIPSTFSGVKSISVSTDFSTAIKGLYVGTFGKPTYWGSGADVTVAEDSGQPHRGVINLSKAGVKRTMSVGSMLSDFTGVIAKFKSIGYKAVITRQ